MRIKELKTIVDDRLKIELINNLIYHELNKVYNDPNEKKLFELYLNELTIRDIILILKEDHFNYINRKRGKIMGF